MAEPSAEDLDGLLALADTDAAIRRNQARLDDLPEQRRLEELDEQVRDLEQRHADVRLRRDDAAATAGKHDRDVAQLRERLAAEQQRMYGGGITNARELSKLEAEIQAVQERIDEHELAELEAMEQMEELDATLSGLKDQRDELAETRVAAERGRDEAASGLVAEIAELEVGREAQRKALPDDLLARYDESAQRHRGNAVGRLDGDRCTACGISLSYADVNALYEGPPLTHCPSCRRLLVVA